jgi:hypothetical protein
VAGAQVHRGAGLGEEEQRESSWFEHGCIAVICLITLFAVVLPLLVWAAAIVFAGSRP